VQLDSDLISASRFLPNAQIGYIGDMRKYVNWLILFFIVLIVGSVLMVGVAKVRDSANRINCQNNLKQMGLAAHNYYDTFKHLPPATMPNSALVPEQRFSWLFSIYPYQESENISRRCDKSKAWDAEENRFAALVMNKLDHCPSTDRPPAGSFVPTNYLGITGVGRDAAKLPLGDPKAGLFGYDRKITFGDIKDGMSYTLMAIETAWPSGAWTAGGPATVRGLEPEGSPYLGVPGQFGGNHIGGTNVVLVDASVHFLKTSFDPVTLEAMATIAGGETISSAQFKEDRPN